MTLLKRLWPAMLGLVALLGLWQGLVVATGVPGYVLPSPLAVVQALAAHVTVLAVALHSEDTAHNTACLWHPLIPYLPSGTSSWSALGCRLGQ